RPRFTDIATTLAGLATYSGRDERDLFASYLEAVRHLTGVALDEAEAWKEVLLFRIVDAYQGLPWRVERAAHPGTTTMPRDTALAMHDDLQALSLLD
ncbi:MAG: hypothetical protein ACRDQA_00415, partial [Nocardioidaceae bacterium]